MGTTRNIVIGQKVSPAMWQTAKQLRRQMTPEEKIIWQHLRAKRLRGLHFRRQQIIGRYVVDFYCRAAGLVVEVDGVAHAYQVKQDQEREALLSARGLQILRFKNQQVREDLARVLAQIAEACQLRIASPTQPPAPSLQGKGSASPLSRKERGWGRGGIGQGERRVPLSSQERGRGRGGRSIATN